jgi:nicotinamidase/pyrazinamidase
MTNDRIVLWEVDAQVDFMLPGGKLYVPGAEKIIPNIQRLVDEARQGRVFLVSSGDAHTSDDPEFKTFPPHCVKGTPGAAIIPEGLASSRLTVPNDASFELPRDLSRYQQVVFEKQTLDVFKNPKTSELVRLLGADVEYIVFGVVTEYCVNCAVNGLLKLGKKVSVVQDAIETLKPEEGNRTLAELKAAGARLISTDQAIAMVEARATQRAM